MMLLRPRGLTSHERVAPNNDSPTGSDVQIVRFWRRQVRHSVWRHRAGVSTPVSDTAMKFPRRAPDSWEQRQTVFNV